MKFYGPKDGVWLITNGNKVSLAKFDASGDVITEGFIVSSKYYLLTVEEVLEAVPEEDRDSYRAQAEAIENNYGKIDSVAIGNLPDKTELFVAFINDKKSVLPLLSVGSLTNNLLDLNETPPLRVKEIILKKLGDCKIFVAENIEIDGGDLFPDITGDQVFILDEKNNLFGNYGYDEESGFSLGALYLFEKKPNDATINIMLNGSNEIIGLDASKIEIDGITGYIFLKEQGEDELLLIRKNSNIRNNRRL